MCFKNAQNVLGNDTSNSFFLEGTKITLFVSLSEVQDQSVIYIFAIAILYFAQLPMSDSDLRR